VVVEAAITLPLIITIVAGVAGIGAYVARYQDLNRVVDSATQEYARFIGGDDPAATITTLVAMRMNIQTSGRSTAELQSELGVSIAAEQRGEFIVSITATETQAARSRRAGFAAWFSPAVRVNASYVKSATGRSST